MRNVWKHFVALVAWILCVSLSLNVGIGQDGIEKLDKSPGKHEPASLLMEAKLSNSQQLLRGLVTEDFEGIAKASRKLKKIAEAAHWPSAIDEVYQHHSIEFRRQCEKLTAHAEKKDIQAAYFTFLQVTTSCVDCHNYVRPRFKVQKKPNGPIRLIPTEWNRQQYPERPSPDDSKTITREALPRKLLR